MANLGVGDGFLPVRIVGSNIDEPELHVGDFPGGVVLQGMTLISVENGRPIANLTKLPGTGTDTIPPVFLWEVPAHRSVFRYLFMQVMPEGAPIEMEVPGFGRQLFH